MRARYQGITGCYWRQRAAAKLVTLMLVAQCFAAPLSGQSNQAGGAPPTQLRIRILTKTPLTEPAGALSAHTLQVRILDEWDIPVRGATVSFRLPEAGPGGVFLNGLSSEIAITDERGEAAVQGFDWRSDAGVTFVHVIAAYGPVRAGAMVEVHLAHMVRALPPAAGDLGARAPASVVSPQSSTREIPRNAAPEREQILGRVGTAEDEAAGRAAMLATPTASPRSHTPDPPDADFQAPEIRPQRAPGNRDANAGDPAASTYVRVRPGRSGGGKKALTILLVVGAAAGGAIAVGMASGSSGGSNPGDGTTPPAVSIGNPIITISSAGGN